MASYHIHLYIFVKKLLSRYMYHNYIKMYLYKLHLIYTSLDVCNRTSFHSLSVTFNMLLIASHVLVFVVQTCRNQCQRKMDHRACPIVYIIDLSQMRNDICYLIEEIFLCHVRVDVKVCIYETFGWTSQNPKLLKIHSYKDYTNLM